MRLYEIENLLPEDIVQIVCSNNDNKIKTMCTSIEHMCKIWKRQKANLYNFKVHSVVFYHNGLAYPLECTDWDIGLYITYDNFVMLLNWIIRNDIRIGHPYNYYISESQKIPNDKIVNPSDVYSELEKYCPEITKGKTKDAYVAEIYNHCNCNKRNIAYYLNALHDKPCSKKVFGWLLHQIEEVF